MGKDNDKYYEPLEQMMAVRHQYMSKVIKAQTGMDIYRFFHDKKVLDIGCGTGQFLKNYSEMGSKCTGVDISDNFIFKKSKNLTYYEAEANTFLESCNKKFDVVFLFEFLEHLDEKEKNKIFKNLKKLLNKKSYIFISTLNKNSVSKYLSINIAENLLNLLPKSTHDYDLFITPDQLQTIGKKYKFKLVNSEGMLYNPLLKNFKLSKINIVNYFCTLQN